MAGNKKYAPAQEYKKKLSKVMERLDIKDFDWNWDRHGGWVKFNYKGLWYIFEHTVQKAREAGENLTFGSDAFAQPEFYSMGDCRFCDCCSSSLLCNEPMAEELCL